MYDFLALNKTRKLTIRNQWNVVLISKRFIQKWQHINNIILVYHGTSGPQLTVFFFFAEISELILSIVKFHWNIHFNLVTFTAK